MDPTPPDPPADPDPPDLPTWQAVIVTQSPLDSPTREEIRAVGARLAAYLATLPAHPTLPVPPSDAVAQLAEALETAWLARNRWPTPGMIWGVMGREQTIPLADGLYPVARIFYHRPLDRRVLVRIVEGPMLPQEPALLHAALAWCATHTAIAGEAAPIGVLCVTQPAPLVQLVLLDPREVDSLQTVLAPDLVILLATLATTRPTAGPDGMDSKAL